MVSWLSVVSAAFDAYTAIRNCNRLKGAIPTVFFCWLRVQGHHQVYKVGVNNGRSRVGEWVWGEVFPSNLRLTKWEKWNFSKKASLESKYAIGWPTDLTDFFALSNSSELHNPRKALRQKWNGECTTVHVRPSQSHDDRLYGPSSPVYKYYFLGGDRTFSAMLKAKLYKQEIETVKPIYHIVSSTRPECRV